LVGDCPRCGASRITFDLTSQTGVVEVRYDWQHWYEAFCICRHCGHRTIFFLSEAGINEGKVVCNIGLAKIEGAVNRFVRVEGFVSRKYEAGIPPPLRLVARTT
jgi:transcription elongation factor Elf1